MGHDVVAEASGVAEEAFGAVEEASGVVEEEVDAVVEEGRHRDHGGRLEHDRVRREDLHLETGLALVRRLAWGTQQMEAGSSPLL